jgi:hypothetical protein
MVLPFFLLASMQSARMREFAATHAFFMIFSIVMDNLGGRKRGL